MAQSFKYSIYKAREEIPFTDFNNTELQKHSKSFGFYIDLDQLFESNKVLDSILKNKSLDKTQNNENELKDDTKRKDNSKENLKSGMRNEQSKQSIQGSQKSLRKNKKNLKSKQ